ncbi:MAG: hypothetical protein H6Q02_553, partial [Acidobacteria bacterium]|nr:hypothetical protein [Acidobacteriota bacterium]
MRALLVAVLVLVAATAAAAAESPCVTCHEQQKVAQAALRDWKTSRHSAMDVACDSCHLTGDTAKATSACPTKGVQRSV